MTEKELILNYRKDLDNQWAEKYPTGEFIIYTPIKKHIHRFNQFGSDNLMPWIERPLCRKANSIPNSVCIVYPNIRTIWPYLTYWYNAVHYNDVAKFKARALKLGFNEFDIDCIINNPDRSNWAPK